MKTELRLTDNYKQILYVICFKSKEVNEDHGWEYHHTYTDLKKAKEDLKKLILNNHYDIEYKIRKFVVTGKDIITDQTLSLLDNRDTCDCFYCGKTIESGDELIFGDATEEIYCSHKCVSKSMDNEEFTVLSNTDKYEYLPWFTEKEM